MIRVQRRQGGRDEKNGAGVLAKKFQTRSLTSNK
jgi:hypothetical protein